MTNTSIKRELTNYELFQLNKYGNILPTPETTPDGDLFESGIDELNRLAEWIDAQAEQRLYESEK